MSRDTMKAIVQDSYGSPDVLRFTDVDKPAVGDDQVLIRVHASSMNALEWHLLTGMPYLVRPTAGFFKPKRRIPGADVAGQVEAVGQDVTRFQVGDRVFGDIGGGAYAQYVSVADRNLVAIPDGVTYEQAASLPVAALTALQGLRDKGGLQAGQKVLIIGASGGVGSFAVSVANALGAEVTAVCSTRNVEIARAIGADHVIDYTKEDYIKTDDRYDLIYDGPGNRPLADLKAILGPEGTYVMFGGPKGRFLGPIPRLLGAALTFMFGSQSAAFYVAEMNRDDLEFLGGLVASGQLEPVIERTYTLEEVPSALRAQGEFHARGKTVITL